MRLYRKTRKAQRGGSFGETDASRLQLQLKRVNVIPGQIIHCVSQLKRFVKCFQAKPVEGIDIRLVQFAYNLGRLQELCADTTRHDIWWKPIEPLVAARSWAELETYVDSIQTALGVQYDAATLEKSC